MLLYSNNTISVKSRRYHHCVIIGFRYIVFVNKYRISIHVLQIKYKPALSFEFLLCVTNQNDNKFFLKKLKNV